MFSVNLPLHILSAQRSHASAAHTNIIYNQISIKSLYTTKSLIHMVGIAHNYSLYTPLIKLAAVTAKSKEQFLTHTSTQCIIYNTSI